MKVSEELAETARYMMGDLKDRRLRVALAFPEWDMGYTGVRIVEERNPLWYQEFCAHYSPSRRARPRKRRIPDTFIKRRHTIRGLKEISEGRVVSVYAQRLLPYVQEQHKKLPNQGWMLE